jgi:hypothetical protein
MFKGFSKTWPHVSKSSLFGGFFDSQGRIYPVGGAQLVLTIAIILFDSILAAFFGKSGCVVNRVVKVLNGFAFVRLDFERLACIYEGKPLYFGQKLGLRISESYLWSQFLNR